MPAPLTLPWHPAVHRHVLDPMGSGIHPSPVARGLSRRGSPCSGLATHRKGPMGWVGAHSPGHRENCMATCTSKACILVLAQLGLCLSLLLLQICLLLHGGIAASPGTEPKGFSADTSTRRWHKQGPDLQVSPACLPLTPVTPQCSRVCLDRGVMMKQGSSHLPSLPTEL